MNDKYFKEVLLPVHIKLQGLYSRHSGVWEDDDKCWCRECNQRGLGSYFRHSQGCPVEPLCIPRTIDDSSPEAYNRSLMGMLDGYASISRGTSTEWTIGVWMDGKETELLFNGASLTEAVLRALCSQEGIAELEARIKELEMLLRRSHCLLDSIHCPDACVLEKGDASCRFVMGGLRHSIVKEECVYYQPLLVKKIL